MKTYCLLTAGLLALLAASPARAQWDISTVDSAGDVGYHTSLRLFGDGRPRISYLDNTNGHLKYAAYNGGWTLSTVDSAPGVGYFTSLALDGTGLPRISYFDNTNRDLKYAAFNGAAWALSTVDSAGEVGYTTSLALDSTGLPRISYFGNQDLKYAAYNGTAWTLSTLDPGDGGSDGSLALDSAGRPHISYNGGVLKYAAFDGSAWTFTTVDSVQLNDRTSLALDSTGLPRISYGDNINGDLKYAAFDGTSWIITTVDSVGKVGWRQLAGARQRRPTAHQLLRRNQQGPQVCQLRRHRVDGHDRRRHAQPGQRRGPVQLAGARQRGQPLDQLPRLGQRRPKTGEIFRPRALHRRTAAWLRAPAAPAQAVEK